MSVHEDNKWHYTPPEEWLKRKEWSAFDAMLLFTGLHPERRYISFQRNHSFKHVIADHIERLGQFESGYPLLSREELQNQLNDLRKEAQIARSTCMEQMRDQGIENPMVSLKDALLYLEDNDRHESCEKWLKYYDESEDLLNLFIKKWIDSIDLTHDNVEQHIKQFKETPAFFLQWGIENNLTQHIPWWDEAVQDGSISESDVRGAIKNKPRHPNNSQQPPTQRNSFIIKAGLCRITWQGIELAPIPAATTLRRIGDRLAEPHQKWKPAVTSITDSLQPDSQTKRAVSAKHKELIDRLAITNNIDESEEIDSERKKLEDWIKDSGSSISDNGGIVWNKNIVDKTYRSFKRSITRGVSKIEESQISGSLSSHLNTFLSPKKYYTPPPDENFKWFVEMEPDKGVSSTDPLAKMSEEEKNQKNYEK